MVRSWMFHVEMVVEFSSNSFVSTTCTGFNSTELTHGDVPREASPIIANGLFSLLVIVPVSIGSPSCRNVPLAQGQKCVRPWKGSKLPRQGAKLVLAYLDRQVSEGSLVLFRGILVCLLAR